MASDLCYAFRDTLQVCSNLNWKWDEEWQLKKTMNCCEPRPKWELSLEENICKIVLTCFSGSFTPVSTLGTHLG